MKVVSVGLCTLVFWILSSSAFAQQPVSSQPTDITCTFADGKGLRVQYDRSEKPKSHGLPIGKAWSPAGKPLSLFLDTSVSIGNTALPMGAYSLFVIPGKSDWELVVNKDVGAGATRNASQDLAKTAMQTGELQHGEDVATIFLAHIGPNQCNVRIVYGKTMAWGEIHEK